jgi:hypothetical protein
MGKLARFHVFGHFNAVRSICFIVSKNLAHPYFIASITFILFPCKTYFVISVPEPARKLRIAAPAPFYLSQI